MNRITVQYRIKGQYGETVAKSQTLSVARMVETILREAKPGIYFRIMDDSGVLFEDADYGRRCSHGYRGDPDTCVDCKAVSL